MLYLGTDNALYVTWDDGGHWTQLRNDLPPAPVYWMQVQPTFNDLVIGTHGRGVYILDDVTPLRTWDTSQSEAFHLFPPRAGVPVPVPRTTRAKASRTRTCTGESAQYGADINFSLTSVTATPNVEVSIVGSGQRDDSHADGRRPPRAQSRVVGPALRQRLDDHDADAAAVRAVGAGAPAVRRVRHADSAGGADRAAGHLHGAREGGHRPSRRRQLTVLAGSEVARDAAIDRSAGGVHARGARGDR